jgi:glycosyltransferase involved in cell wall biosynthesis
MSDFQKPMGGTEIMYHELMRRLPDEYKERFSIFNYVSHADFNKPTIFWNQLSYDQPAIEWLKEPSNIDQISHFVFVSHWQSELFRKIFNIAGYKTSVIQNACIGVQQRPFGKRDKVKICYTSTPYRGLDVLLSAWQILKPEDCELHIFSSCKIYGKEFGDAEDAKYQELYDFCRNTEGIVYRGSIDNDKLREELPNFDILAYPCTFEETSCIAVIEALSAGLIVVTSNLGALPETTEGLATIYPYLMDKQTHAGFFASILEKEIAEVRNGKNFEQQSRLYAQRWSWDNRINQWTNLLDTLGQKHY